MQDSDFQIHRNCGGRFTQEAFKVYSTEVKSLLTY
jgi:hypothetical protein